MVVRSFGEPHLEDFHAGITPSSQARDYSDVVVKAPFGEIPWSKLSRLSDEEMKTLMIDVVNRTYVLLQTLFSEDVGSYLIQTLNQQDLVPRWQDPSVKAHAPGQLQTAGSAGISQQSESEFDGTVLLPGSVPCEHPASVPEANRTRQMHLAYRLRNRGQPVSD